MLLPFHSDCVILAEFGHETSIIYDSTGSYAIPGGVNIMKSLFIEWKREIEEYCDENKLDFTKLQHAGKCYGKDFLVFQHVNEQKGRTGLLDETPAEVLLTVRKTDKGLAFQLTEYAQEYLGI